MTPFDDIDMGQHWIRWWLVAWQHQAITWTNVDLSSVRSSYIHLMAISQDTSIINVLQPQQKYLDLLNWEQISCNPQAELKSIHVFYSINLANLFSCYFFYFSTVTFFPVTFFPTCPLLLSFLLPFFLLLSFRAPPAPPCMRAQPRKGGRWEHWWCAKIK